MIYLIVAVIAWWISEGCGLLQKLEYKTGWTWHILNCPRCLAFWWGLFYHIKPYALEDNLIQAILCSAIAIFISKLFRL